MSFVEFLGQLCEYYYFIEIRTTRSAVLYKSIGRLPEIQGGKEIFTIKFN